VRHSGHRADFYDAEEHTLVNKYDPLWEYAGVKHPLVGTKPDVTARCPVCHVIVQLDASARAGQHGECGLCGEQLQITQEEGVLKLEPLAESTQ